MHRILTLALLTTATLSWATPEPESAADAAAKAQAATAPDASAAEQVVDRELVKPLAQKERHHSRFSRVYIPPQVRRIRLPDAVAKSDAKGKTFVTFAIDARHRWTNGDDADWRKDTMTGCVYPERGEVFVNTAGKLYPAALLLGKKSDPAPDGTCKAAEPQLHAAK
jgi:hypothetical protein